MAAEDSGYVYIQCLLGYVSLVILTGVCACSAKDAVAALIKRLAHRNANVQLYTLEVRIAVFFPCEIGVADKCLLAC